MMERAVAADIWSSRNSVSAASWQSVSIPAVGAGAPSAAGPASAMRATRLCRGGENRAQKAQRHSGTLVQASGLGGYVD